MRGSSYILAVSVLIKTSRIRDYVGVKDLTTDRVSSVRDLETT